MVKELQGIRMNETAMIVLTVKSLKLFCFMVF
jgi:hypothetical protein